MLRSPGIVERDGAVADRDMRIQIQLRRVSPARIAAHFPQAKAQFGSAVQAGRNRRPQTVGINPALEDDDLARVSRDRPGLERQDAQVLGRKRAHDRVSRQRGEPAGPLIGHLPAAGYPS
jgi:hypothetical protein